MTVSDLMAALGMGLGVPRPRPNPSWWESRAYRDPAYRYAMIEADLLYRAVRYREAHPVVKLGASLALAGAAAASRTRLLSIDRALYLLAAIEGE